MATEMADAAGEILPELEFKVRPAESADLFVIDVFASADDEDTSELEEVIEGPEPGPVVAVDEDGIDDRANLAATSLKNDLREPSDAEKEAGNYKKGRLRVNGIANGIENPAGSIRSGMDSNGKRWSNKLRHHYGDITGTKGMDGDQVDVFVKPGIQGDHFGPVFVIDQVDPKTRKPDEHKVMIGFKTTEQATKAYKANYMKGWSGLGAITEMGPEQFSGWVKDGDHSKPVSESVSRSTKSGLLKRANEAVIRGRRGKSRTTAR